MSKPVFVLLTVIGLAVMGSGLIYPVLPLLLHAVTEPASEIDGHYAALISLYALMQLFFSPLLGILSDRIGRKPVLILSLCGGVLDYFMMVWAPTLAWLYVGRAISGITGANITIATAYMSDFATDGSRASKFGYVNAAMGLGLILGPAMGGLLGTFNLRAPFIAAATLNAMMAIAVKIWLPESHTARSTLDKPEFRGLLASLKSFQLISNIFPLFVIYILIITFAQATGTLWLLYGFEHLHWSKATAGFSLAAYGAWHATLQTSIVERLIRYINERRALLLTFAANGIALALMGIVADPMVPFLLLPLFALGSVGTPIVQAMMSDRTAENRQGELQGLLTSGANLAVIACPLGISAIYSATRSTQPGFAWEFAAVLAMLALPLMFLADKTRRNADGS